MRVWVENGRMVRVEAHPFNKATPTALCVKGLSYVERAHSPDRIVTPLKRNPVNGGFKPITWDEALGTIAEKLTFFRDTYGPQSVLYYTGSGTKGLLNDAGPQFWRLYGGYTSTYGDLCWPSGMEATRLTLGANKHNAPWDIANARLIVLWGKNPAETNIHQMVFIEEALERGATLVVIDPRRTQSAERASLLIQPRPGTDGVLALAVAHLLFKNNWIDRFFLEQHALGLEAYEEMVQAYTPERAAGISDVPVEHIHQLAQLMGTTGPATINAGFGLQRYTNSGQSVRAILALLVLTGNIGKPGAGWIFANLQTDIFGALKDPIASYPPETPDGIERCSISTTRLGKDILATRNPSLRMIWVERGNPVTQNPDTNSVLEAFRSLDFRIAVEQFMTDTAREADLILPAKTMFEQSDVIGAYWHPYIQLKQKMLEPPTHVKPESEIYYLLAKRLGFEEKDLAGKIPGPGDEAVDLYLKSRLPAFPSLTWEKLREGPVLVPNHQEIAFSDYIFPTSSGKIELVSREARVRWSVDELPHYDEPEESIRSGASEGRTYPLYLMTPNLHSRIHSQFNNLAIIQAIESKAIATIHPKVAQRRGIEDGDTIRVFNDRGTFTVEARLDFGIKTGCISVANGWWNTDAGTVNCCSAGRETDMGYGAAFHDNMVDIEKVVKQREVTGRRRLLKN